MIHKLSYLGYLSFSPNNSRQMPDMWREQWLTCQRKRSQNVVHSFSTNVTTGLDCMPNHMAL